VRAERIALPVFDLAEAESFYSETTQRATALAARRGGENGFAVALPYSRVIVGNAHIYLCLSDRHLEEAPPEQLRGTPRLALTATPQQLARASEVFTRHGVCFEGPVAFPSPSPVASALYLRDPAGNFLELCCARSH
jgi:catechol-2,3-dioxygenase